VTVTTYVNASDYNTLDKDITAVDSSVTVICKDDTDILHPTLIFSENMDMDFNYLYITELGRYYFVRSKSLAQQRYYVNCEVDVLMSYNAQIKDLSVIADRSSSTFNLYQTDEEIPCLVKSDVATQPFPAGFTGQSLLITTAGG
jgi:hypothetical protein